MSATAGIIRHDHDVYAIDTDYVRPQMDASHLLTSNGRAAFVDVGTNNSVPLLLRALATLDISPANVDYVLVTHVHLDHAGGAGLLLQQLPNATVVVHPRGQTHLAEPAKLIKGTVAVYGEQRFQDMYGGVTPIPAERLHAVTDSETITVGSRPLQCFFTEGHARHHYCVFDEHSRGVFTGDSFGVSYRELDTANGAFIFPSSTPIDFDPDAAHDSIERILSFAPECAFLTHYSRVTDLRRLAADMHTAIDFYASTALAHEHTSDRRERIAADMLAEFLQRLHAHGFVGNRQTAEQILGFDIELNTMGLDVWLQRRQTKPQLN